MSLPPRPSRAVSSPSRAIGNGAPANAEVPPDWTAWLRRVERKRRLLARLAPPRKSALPDSILRKITLASFRLDGIELADHVLDQALLPARAHDAVRSRLAMRLRSHMAILHRMGRTLRLGEPLKVPAVVRWYTMISSGLSIAGLDEPTMLRLEQLVRRINSPHLRLQPAIQEIARLYAHAIADPLVPGFNGILARLLLNYHLGRCGLPPGMFETAPPPPTAPQLMLSYLLSMIDRSYDLLMLTPRPA